MATDVVPWSDCLGYLSSDARKLSKTVPKLVNLAGEFVSTRPELIVNFGEDVLPNCVYQLLLASALKNRCADSAKAIMAHYPDEKLLLSELRFKPATDCTDSFMQSVTTTVVRAFIESLEEKAPLKLTCVDMRDYPLGGPGLAYLAVHSLLSYKEAERRKLMDSVEKTLRLRSAAAQNADRGLIDRLGNTVPDTLPNKLYHFIVDCALDGAEEDLFENLCLALKTSNMLSSFGGLRLTIGNLQLNRFSESKISMLLDLLGQPPLVSNSRNGRSKFMQNLQLTGLALHYCSLRASNRLRLNRFPNICKLELHGSMGEQMSVDNLLVELGALNRLSRLSLSGVAVRGRLAEILARCRVPLQFLALNDCDLNLNDLNSLTDWPMIGQLEWLEIRRNQAVAADLNALCTLLRSCSSSLQILVLRELSLSDEHIERFSTILAECENCRRVDILGNRLWESASILRFCQRLAAHRSLEEIGLDLPVDTYVNVNEAGNGTPYPMETCYVNMELFLERANGILSRRKGDRPSSVELVARPVFLHDGLHH